ncbi:Predicted dienelactone hydrolase [Roseateles sp. YR242]|uniref:alpha/beta hydrolase family protein n=1 Tax=Roseateles sp. YR242 TaxID=1855305 RepID=UPI0008B7CB72|nr:hypothetical protein [Roseateles sp. YR242]SEK79623.1 Predicted dienelactone hydrolase [Roseateles sp. YR242]
MTIHRRAFLASTTVPLFSLLAGLPGASQAEQALPARPVSDEAGINPGISGGLTQGVTQGVWHDARRSRDVPWRLRLPTPPATGSAAVAESTAAAGQIPLIIFSHGLGGSLDGGTEWGQAWAAAGMATLHLQHAGSDRAIWAGGLRGVKAAASVEQLVARCLDVRFAVEQLLQLQQTRDTAWARIRPDALGMSGHSFGAHTTLAVAGRRFPVRLAAELAEPRFKAFTAFSPAAGVSPEGLRAITRPMLCLTGSLDGDPLGQERSGNYRRAVYDTLPPGAKAQLWLEGADHMTFGGNGEPGAGLGQRLAGRRRPEAPQTLAAHHAAVIRSVTTDWWRAHLLDDSAAMARLRSPQGLKGEDSWQQG